MKAGRSLRELAIRGGARRGTGPFSSLFQAVRLSSASYVSASSQHAHQRLPVMQLHHVRAGSHVSGVGKL